MTTGTPEDDSAASSPEEILIVGVAASCVVFELRRCVEEDCTRCGRFWQAREVSLLTALLGEQEFAEEAR